MRGSNYCRNHLPGFGWSLGEKVTCCQSHSRDPLEIRRCGGPGGLPQGTGAPPFIPRLCRGLSLVQTFPGRIELLLQSVPSCNAVKTQEEFLHVPIGRFSNSTVPAARGTSLGRGSQACYLLPWLHQPEDAPAKAAIAELLGALWKHPFTPRWYRAWAQPDQFLLLPVWWSKYLRLSEWGWQQPQNFALDSKCHV